MIDPPAQSPAVRLPAEILAYIIELSIITSTPSPPRIDPTISTSTSPFSTPLRSTYSSSWSWTSSLLFISKFFYSISRPLLLKTITLDSTDAGVNFFTPRKVDWQEGVDRAWFGNVTTLERECGVKMEPVKWRLEEAGWYEECSGGFVVGHAYASRLKTKRKRKKEARERRYRSVSVYWAEEQLVEEVTDGTSSESDSDGSDGEEVKAIRDGGLSLSLSHDADGRDEASMSTRRRASHQEPDRGSDPRIDRPHEPAWQTLYSRQRRMSPVSSRARAGSSSMGGGNSDQGTIGNGSSQAGPAEGDLDPWDMQDAQERLAALANASAQHTEEATVPVDDSLDSATTTSALDDNSSNAQPAHPRRDREIYAYHICTATLEPFIQPLLSSIRSLRLITLTFYPGHPLDDDKLEHMLRRILSPLETPRLETLLIRICFDAASAGSRMRRFERTKTIAGAVDRIGDERVRVMLVHGRVGEGELVELGAEAGIWSSVSRKAIGLTKEGWWSRALQHHHHRKVEQREQEGEGEEKEEGIRRREEQERRLSDWKMFFPPSQYANPAHLVNLIHHCDPWPDCPDPV